jgi:hypothetical protein
MSDLYFSIRKSFLTAEESREFDGTIDASNACGE